jgi:hypothetical protein
MATRLTTAILVFSIALLAVPLAARAAEPHGAGCCLTLDSLTHMSRCELEELYRNAPPAPPLDGYYAGRSMKRTKATGMIWKGKLFCGADCTLVNRWCCGLQAIQAKVYPGESWFDGKPALIMDYRETSHVWKDVRDELREVCPGLYLGIMYHDKGCCPKFATFFALECGCQH